MDEISTKIAESRPPLSRVSPLAHRMCQGFVGVNIILGFYLFYVAERASDALPLFGHAVSFEFWAVVAFIIAGGLWYGLCANNWNVIKAFLITGLLMKTFWTFSLIYLAMNGSNVLDVAFLWLFLAWAQAWTLVHFVPVIGWNGDDNRGPGEEGGLDY